MPPNRETRRALLKYEQAINQMHTKINPPDTKPPFVARLPLIQPALVHFFSHQMSSNHWCHLIRTELDRKKRDNEHTLLQAKIYNELIYELNYRAQGVLDFPYEQPKLRTSINTRTFLELKQEEATNPTLLFALMIVTITLINVAVKIDMLDKSWSIGLVPGKNSSQTFEPNSFFATVMLLLLLSHFTYILLNVNECAKDIDPIERPSLDKLEPAYAKLRLYPSELLDHYRNEYDRHIRGEHLMNESELHALLKKVKALQKTEKPDDLVQAKEQPTPPEAAPNERSPRRRPA